MNLKTWYDSGSATVLSGSTTVSGTGAIWGTGGPDDNIMVGDLFSVPSQPMVPAIPIAAVSAGGELELLWPWPGTDVTAQPYIIRYVGIIERSTRANRMALERMGEISAWYDVIVEADADRLDLETAGSPLRAGYRVLVKADGVIWAKATSAFGDWIGPVEFKGDKGDTGDQGPIGRGATPRGTYNPATAYVLDDAVLDNGSTWTALQATTGNAPPVLPATSNAYWQLLARKGTDGTGTGDVIGPSGAVADMVAAFNGTTGKIIKDSGVPLSVLPGVSASTDPVNFNEITAPGRYRNILPSTSPNAPPGTNFWHLDVYGHSATARLQIAMPYGGNLRSNSSIPAFWRGTLDAVTWGAWVPFAGSMVGAVAQVSGTPTGAASERGANANGTWERFANGLQICTKRITNMGPVTLAAGSLFASSGYPIGSWAAEFTAVPACTCGLSNSAGLGGLVQFTGVPTSVAGHNVQVIRPTSHAGTDYSADIVAIGRWF